MAAEFDKYRASPEYQLQNKGMALEDFKVIYWWEWGHRQLGRVSGWSGRRVSCFSGRTQAHSCGLDRAAVAAGRAGGLQGAIGWWMVASGLTGDRVDVASYRLATHLGLAFVILGFIAGMSFLLGRSETDLMQARRGRRGGCSACRPG
jgi:heme a synthase